MAAAAAAAAACLCVCECHRRLSGSGRYARSWRFQLSVCTTEFALAVFSMRVSVSIFFRSKCIHVSFLRCRCWQCKSIMYVDSFWLNQRSKWLSVRCKKSRLILFGLPIPTFSPFLFHSPPLWVLCGCSVAQRMRNRVSVFIRMINYTRVCTIAQMEKYNLCDVRVRGERTSVHYIFIDFKCLCSLLIALPVGEIY